MNDYIERLKKWWYRVTTSPEDKMWDMIVENQGRRISKMMEEQRKARGF